jgi:hypothetical protein
MSQSIEIDLLRQVLEEIRLLREERTVKGLPTFLSLEDAAREMSVSERTLRRMVRNGQVLPATIGSSPKIPVSELRRLATQTPRYPSARSPGSGRALPPKKFPKGYSVDVERKKLAELRKKRR